MIGNVYDRLTVLRVEGRKAFCRCACGTEKWIDRFSVANGGTRSCGCLQRERSVEANVTHGGTYTEEYAIWRNLLSRCYNPKNPRYDRYGGRGIAVFGPWRDDFAAFFEYVGSRPSHRHSLERISNDAGYEPGNVRWATSKEQSRNRSTNRVIKYLGREATLAAWSEELGIPASTISARLYRGWSEQKALSTSLLR
jgi:hypothetical protein